MTVCHVYMSWKHQQSWVQVNIHAVGWPLCSHNSHGDNHSVDVCVVVDNAAQLPAIRCGGFERRLSNLACKERFHLARNGSASAGTE